jgi:hypothetical protein
LGPNIESRSAAASSLVGSIDPTNRPHKSRVEASAQAARWTAARPTSSKGRKRLDHRLYQLLALWATRRTFACPDSATLPYCLSFNQAGCPLQQQTPQAVGSRPSRRRSGCRYRRPHPRARPHDAARWSLHAHTPPRLDEPAPSGQPDQPVRISGIHLPVFPEPTPLRAQTRPSQRGTATMP